MKEKYINPYTDFEFEKLLANLGQADLNKYESSLKVYRDLKGVIDTAFGEGKEEGKLERGLEIARQLKRLGIDPLAISQATGLSVEEINSL